MILNNILRRNYVESARYGVNNSSWKGGVTSLKKQIRECANSDFWRKSILIRDNYTCICCNKRGHYLEVDHIKPFSLILFENNITSLEQALGCEELWDINNGRTLCKKCHYDTDTFGQGTKLLLDNLCASKISMDSTIDANTVSIIEHSF